MSVTDQALSVVRELGWKVFPCGASKRPCISRAEGGHGFHDATLDPAEVERLFAHRGAALVGTPTGLADGFDVLDIDYRNGGGAWEAENEWRLPETRIHRTQSGGRHYLFRHVHGVRNSAADLAPGVDVRGRGGYVVLPPSKGYSIDSDVDIAEWPDWLLEMVLAQSSKGERPKQDTDKPVERYSSKRIAGLVRWALGRVAAANPDGGKHYALRNYSLFLGGLIAHGGPSGADTTEDLLRALPAPAADWNLARKTIAWGFQHGAEEPLDLDDRPYNGNATNGANGHAETPGIFKQPNGVDGNGHDVEYDWDAILDPKPSTEATYPGDTGDPHEQPQKPVGEPPQQDETEEVIGDPPSGKLKLVYFNDIQPNLDAADFVENLLIEGGMSVVYGESNSGKTFFVSDLAMHIALGIPWCGREVELGGVVYCALEGSHGIGNRLSAYRIKHEVDEAFFVPFGVIPSSVNLLDPTIHLSELIDKINAAKKTMSVPVKLVVIDTLARALSGGNENAPDDMGALVTNADQIRQKTGAHVLFVHHTGKDTARGARGHSSLVAATDTEIEISDIEGQRLAHVTKQRELECSGEFAFTLDVIELGINRRNKVVTSCVVNHGDQSGAVDANGEPVPVADTAKKRRPRLSGHTRMAFDTLTNVLAMSGKPGFGAPAGVLSVPDEWWRERFYADALPGADASTKRKAFRRAADALVDLGMVAMVASRVWQVHESGN